MTEPTNAIAIVSLPPSERAAIALDSKTAESQLRDEYDSKIEAERLEQWRQAVRAMQAWNQKGRK